MVEKPKQYVSCALYHNCEATTVKNWYFWPSISIHTQSYPAANVAHSLRHKITCQSQCNPTLRYLEIFRKFTQNFC